MNRNVLIVTSSDISNPQRGTPIRIVKFVEQISRCFDKVFLVAKNADLGRGYVYLKSPEGNFIRRFLYYKNLLKKEQISWIFTPTETDIKMVLLLKIFTKAKIAIDIHGLTHEEMYYFGSINLTTKKFLSWRNRLFVRFFDVVYVVSNKMRNYFSLKERGVVVYGGVSLNDFPVSDIYKEEFNSQPMEIAYTGNLREYQGLAFLLDTLVELKKRDFNFVIKLVVSGNENEIETTLKNKGLYEMADVKVNIPHYLVNQEISKSDVLVIPRPMSDVTEYSFPSKLTECLATGIPVLTTNVGPVEELLTNKKNCLISPTCDIEDMTKTFEALFKMCKKDRRSMGLEARRLVEELLQWDTLGETICSTMKSDN